MNPDPKISEGNTRMAGVATCRQAQVLAGLVRFGALMGQDHTLEHTLGQGSSRVPGLKGVGWAGLTGVPGQSLVPSLRPSTGPPQGIHASLWCWAATEGQTPSTELCQPLRGRRQSV